MRPAWLALFGLVVFPSLAHAQRGTHRPTLQTPRGAATKPAARDTNLRGVRDTLPPGAARDSLHRDSTQAQRVLVQWAEPDSVMAALLAKQGYTVTRYQGKTVVFNATEKAIEVKGNAAISHEQTILVADSIHYNDSTKKVLARSAPGDTIVLRDPSQGTGDIYAPGGQLTYDIATKHGTGTNLNTTTGQGGQTWYVTGEHVGFRADSSTNGHPISYAKGGSITTDSMPEPDYHFQVGEVKVISKRLMVARPAVLYLQDIPVLWFPFIFQDMRSGRRSGILPPRVGLTDVIRTSSGYRRTVENIGYYFALNDYTDLEVWLDWRSANGGDQSSNPFGLSDPGWTRYNAIFNYSWLNRFLSGGIQTSYSKQSDGSTNFQLGWQHNQQFSQRSRLSANINYASNTIVQRQQAFNVAQALAAISSTVNFQQQLGPASMSIGGTRKQYTGRTEVDQTFPTLTITSKPVNLASWLVWSPNFSMTNTQQFNLDQIGSQFSQRYFLNNGALDSSKVQQNTRNTTLSFDTPLRIGNFVWRNSFRVSDAEIDFPTVRTIVGVRDTSQHVSRVFARSYLTTVDWDTGINLPSFSTGKWNITPSVQIVNVDPGGYWVRSERTGSSFVHQSKRMQYSLSISPTFYGLFPGFGPFSRIRHSISPGISYTFAPAGNVSDEYLAALGKTRVGYLGALQRSQVQLTLRQVIEAKVKSKSDTTAGAGKKLKLLQIDFSPIGWDFERAKATHGTGLSTTNFTYRLSSDLLPGFDLSVGYSLFQGDPLSDTAQFKPFRESISASFSIGRNNNPFATLQRLFGGATPPDSVTVPPQSVIPGTNGPFGRAPTMLGTTPLQNAANGGWQATFNFSSSRQRPIVGGNVIQRDPEQFCHSQFADPLLYQTCLQQQQNAEDTGLPQTTEGGPIVRFPARATLRANLMFNLTPRWAVQWGTGYDFEAHRFSDHFVTLQREFRDWLANFSFSSAPNGNFAFSFYIALKAAPDLKFNYDRRSYRP